MAALACIQWIRDELEAHGDLETLNPPLVDTKSLFEFVKDGRAMCLLTNAVLEGEENELPKKLQRSLKQLSKFHAMERLEEHHVFTTVHLLEEVNETAVSENIMALPNKTRPNLKAVNALAQFYFDGEGSNTTARASTSSTTSSSRSSVPNASKLSSFLNKFPSAPRSKPPMSHNRVSNASPRDFEEPVAAEDDRNNNNSRLRVPFISKGTNNNNSNSCTSATPRSSIISNVSSGASTSKEEGRELRSRSLSSKISAFSCSHSPLSNTSTPKTLSGGDTPPLSPPASPQNKVKIPSVFSTPTLKAPKSSSKLSAFRSTVDTTTSVIPATKAPTQDKKTPEPAVESTPEEATAPIPEDNQSEEQEEEEAVAVNKEVHVEKESVDMGVKAEKNLLKKPPSSAKILAFLHTVGSSSMKLPNHEVSEVEEDDFVPVEKEEVFSAEEDSSAAEE
ncbi:hypothetical protein PsorP6_018383 [Peronosclerospora sorghi]|nr:hypothetical protein PsorP6_018383 [Peronosclerospora sorghi]